MNAPIQTPFRPPAERPESQSRPAARSPERQSGGHPLNGDLLIFLARTGAEYLLDIADRLSRTSYAVLAAQRGISEEAYRAEIENMVAVLNAMLKWTV
jgi:hypothetical protein